ncbi:transcriptional regulator [Microvirga tunisiensis]|uniref:Transcriptional regulator n=2 Tax=Pannonibacter tanglangensis TaxID=2750084 RepID=A0A7X5EZV3_9HYPH|nr:MULTISPECIES: HlyU family transcriptional regulator [unclassified Pannonibacter]NBN63285.1 transcriptional regulator [Pannonibacter sp. XCT-34]NBN76924.1 transcriptional regulator [Pannonibacter sp. XCT-53]
MLGKLLGSLFKGSGPKAPEGPAAQEDYKGFLILAEPRQAGGQWQIAGRILKEVDGEAREHVFIRADQLPSRDEAADFMLRKARSMIDQQGDGIFR